MAERNNEKRGTKGFILVYLHEKIIASESPYEIIPAGKYKKMCIYICMYVAENEVMYMSSNRFAYILCWGSPRKLATHEISPQP